MRAFITRNFAGVVTALGIAVVTLLLVVIAVVVRLAAVGRDLDASRADIARVEAGAALFAAQVQGFQEQLAALAPAVSGGLDEAVSGLAAFRTSTIEFAIPIDQTVPIETVIALNRTIEVPIDTVLPIDETFQTQITVSGPFGIDVPLDVTVPVNVDVPVNVTVSIPVNERIPINTEVPIQLDVPISLDVAGTELATLAASLEAGLRSVEEVFAGLGG
jgi:hypothetical protein